MSIFDGEQAVIFQAGFLLLAALMGAVLASWWMRDE